MKSLITTILIILNSINLINAQNQNEFKKTNPPIYIAFLWHMHQPIYWPYESIIQTEQNNRYPFSVVDIHNQRTGPYTSWPRNAVQKGINANMPHFGAQVSFSGSLIENLNVLEQAGNQNFQNWKSHWNYIKNQTTSLGNPRIDLVGFGYFHPLMPLIDYNDIRRQIQKHKQIFSQNFPGQYSKGIFPPENAFSTRIIPALVDEGLKWVLVDNIHFDRACVGYPYSTAGNLVEPNRADVRNPNPNDWIQLTGLWAPTRNSARWGRQPHYVEYVNPSTGEKKRIIAVPADRYMGNEDGRGGFGALNYEQVMSQLEAYNTDPQHPILIVLHHDGDNYGGGSESYYNHNFQNFVNWLQANPTRFVCTTIEDYLEMFPPDTNDVIHVEDGSWSGADNGDPEFKKWLGDPDATGYSPDRNSWAVLTAAKNFVETAYSIAPNDQRTQSALNYLMVAQSSDYWYWDGSLNGIWDSHPTRAANQAINLARQITGPDNTPPTIFSPQRDPYNPGGTEFGIQQPNNFKVWTYVFDKSGLKSVKLKYRIDYDGVNSPNSIHNETYIGGSEVSEWFEIDMVGISQPSQTNPQPLFKAKEYSAEITGFTNKLIGYYVEAVDSFNNVSKSEIKEVWVGSSSTGTQNRVSWTPQNPTRNDTITITVLNSNIGAKLHWGVNNSGKQWQTPNQVYWTPGTVLYNGTGPAVESPMSGPDTNKILRIKIGPFNKPEQFVNRVAFVIHFNDNTWDNNNGQDYQIVFDGGTQTHQFIMDGKVDTTARKVASNQNIDLYVDWNGSELYVATQSAQSQGRDIFIFIADSLRNLRSSPWAKTGKVMQWDAFLGNESTNNWSGWFDTQGIVKNASGQFLEGAINLQSELGYIPKRVYIAIGAYQTQDGGALQAQCPSGNGNGDLEANEFYLYNLPLTQIKDEHIPILSFELRQNYPNPFNAKTNIIFSIPEDDYVALKVYNLLGQEVQTIVQRKLSKGTYSFEFDGNKLPSGVYYYSLQAQNFRETKKMILLK
ncbi:MAG: T9SS type A sorting domain-containing protein [Ignavibacteria bacterium]|nr:T9SS type A sorting domain-containing protein [Ignavibacteria bacterium]